MSSTTCNHNPKFMSKYNELKKQAKQLFENAGKGTKDIAQLLNVHVIPAPFQ